jgi:hypothetical protein
MARTKDREGLFDPKHYWARRVKKKYKYPRGGRGQYPEKVGEWELDETYYDASLDGNAAYEHESAMYTHGVSSAVHIRHTSYPEGEAWKFDNKSYGSLRAALAALKGRSPMGRPKKRKKAAKKHFSMTAKQLCAVGDKSCRAELKRRGRDSSGKKLR